MSNITIGIFQEMYSLFLQMSPYLILGMGVAGLLHILVKKEYIARHVGRNSLGAVIKASLLGVPLPLCSCGVVPTAVFLKKSGASQSAVVSFLISTPQTGVDSILAAYGMLGPAMAVARPVAAFFSGIFGGVISLIQKPAQRAQAADSATGQNVQGSDNLDDHNVCYHCETDSEQQPAGNLPDDQHTCNNDCCNPQIHTMSVKEKLKSLFSFGFLEFADDIAIPFIIGLVAAGILSYSIPDNYFAGTIASDGIAGMLLMAVVGIPFYICSTSSIPIAVALIMKGISPGAAFVFLMAGPATNAATLGILKKQFGLRMIITYLFSITSGALVFGFLIDFLSETFGLNFFRQVENMNIDDHVENPGILFVIAAAAFGLLLAFTLGKKFHTRVFKGKDTHEHGHLPEDGQDQSSCCKDCGEEGPAT